MNTRRKLLTGIATMMAGIFASRHASASTDNSADNELRFPGDPTDHNVVYQCNKADKKYHDSVLFSATEILRKYGDNVSIVVVAFGPGIHLVGKEPLRHVSEEAKQKIKSMADYGVKFHACGNTMKALGWTKDDLYDFVEVVQVGAADLIELQEQGYSYISW